MPTRYISGGDGTRIAVYDEGNPDGPTVVLVHGWPDSHVLWDGVVPLLAHNYRIIRYDSRGAGASDVPRPVDAYRVDRLADDFAAVVDQLCPGTRVHVVGHDWGAATMWEYVSRPDAADRVGWDAVEATVHTSAEVLVMSNRPPAATAVCATVGIAPAHTAYNPALFHCLDLPEGSF